MYSKKCHVGRGRVEGNRLHDHDADFIPVRIFGRVFRPVFRILDGFYRKLDVIRRKRLSIMPLDAVTDVERVRERFLVILPLLGQPRNNLVCTVMRGQAVKQKDIDFTMLVHGRIDARIVSGTVNEHALLLALHASPRISRTVSLSVQGLARTIPRVAAGRQHKRHGNRHQKGTHFFHLHNISPISASVSKCILTPPSFFDVRNKLPASRHHFVYHSIICPCLRRKPPGGLLFTTKQLGALYEKSREKKEKRCHNP